MDISFKDWIEWYHGNIKCVDGEEYGIGNHRFAAIWKDYVV